MIAEFQPSYRLSDNMFRQAKIIIQRSEAARLIDSYQAPGSERPHNQQGIQYTIEAVLTCALSLIILGRTPSYKAILNTLADLSARQLSEVGMAGQDLSRLFGARKDQDREYHRFERWLTRRLSPLDSQPDQPAHRITNDAHRVIVNSRTPQQQRDYAQAAERLRIVMNKIVAGSIRDHQPEGACGDIVADETIFDLAGPSSGLGAKDHLKRGACYFGAYYARDDHAKGPFSEDAKGTGKRGFGVGVTVAVRVGPPHKLHSVAPVIVGMDIHAPTSGSPEALGTCIEHMKANGLDTRATGKDTYPRVTVDMGYNPKRGWVPFLIKHGYSPVVRYPKHWTLTEASTNPPGSSATAPPGPIQFAGSFYCPAAEQLLRGHTVPKTRQLLKSGRWAEHDRKLAAVLPFLMGTNSRPIVNGRPGRPRLGDEPETHVKAELVCPAVQLRVRCPLKPASMQSAAFGVPLATPTWQADERTCCRQSTLRVTLTQPQLQKATWGAPVVTSWEHALYFEAARSATEQRFSLLKSPHITNLVQMKSRAQARTHGQDPASTGHRGDQPQHPAALLSPQAARRIDRHPDETTAQEPGIRTHPNATENLGNCLHASGPTPSASARFALCVQEETLWQKFPITGKSRHTPLRAPSRARPRAGQTAGPPSPHRVLRGLLHRHQGQARSGQKLSGEFSETLWTTRPVTTSD